MSGELADQIDTLAPSAKLVYKVLEYEGKLTQGQLADETRLPERTVRYALNELQSIDVIAEEINFADARTNHYSLKATD